MTSQQIPITPYKQIGKFCGPARPLIYSIDKLYYMAMPTDSSYKVLSLPDLRVKLLGPTFSEPVVSIAAHNTLLYVASGSSIHVMHYLHLVDKWDFEHKISGIILYEKILVVSLANNEVRVFGVLEKNEISMLIVQGEVKGVTHPPTYLNKVIVYGEKYLELWNIISGNRIYKYDSKEPIRTLLQASEIEVVKCSPMIDFAAVGLTSGLISIMNLKTNQILLRFQSSSPVRSLAFSVDVKSKPLLISGNDQGDFSFWDLNKGQLDVKQVNAHSGEVLFLKCVDYKDRNMFISGSEGDNSVALWSKQQESDTSYTRIRVRSGCKTALSKIRFYGTDSRHIIGYSDSSSCELFDFSVLKEEMTIQISNKDNNKNVLRKKLKTERNAQLGKIVDFDFSLNRENNWSNLISANKYNNRPCFWDVPNRTISKMKIETFSKTLIRRSEKIKEVFLRKRFVTSVAISGCGNYGMAGFNDGYIVKMTMQGGNFSKVFYDFTVHQGMPIRGLFADNLNHFMVSCDSSSIACWDFYAGYLVKQVEEPSGITELFSHPNSGYFAVCTRGNSIKMYEMLQLKVMREFQEEVGIKINDVVILMEDRKMLSCTENKKLKVWDIFSEQKIYTLSLDKEVISMDVNAEGSLLATVFRDENVISLWNIEKLTLFKKEDIEVEYVTPLKLRGRDLRSYYFGNDGEGGEGVGDGLDDIDESLYTEIKGLLESEEDVEKSQNKKSKKSKNSEVQFTSIPQNRWTPLRYIEQIEERNKASKESDVDVPFFLDFDNPLTRMKQQMEKEVDGEQSSKRTHTSKMIKEERKLEFMNDLSDDFVGLLAAVTLDRPFSKNNKKAMKRAFRCLKGQTATKINYLIKTVAFEDPLNVQRMLLMFTFLMATLDDLDIKVMILGAFIRNCYDRVGSLDPEAGIIQKLADRVAASEAKLGEDYRYLSCLVDRFSEIKA